MKKPKYNRFMKKLSTTILLYFCFIFNQSFAISGDNRIAVINIKEVLQNSLAMKEVQNIISEKEKIYQGQIDKQQAKLEAEVKKIESKRSILSEEALNKEKRQFVEKFNKLKAELESKQKSLKNAYTSSMAKLDKKINEIVSKISQERSIDIVLPASGVVSYNRDLDITSRVLRILNKELKTIRINFD